MRKYDTKNKRNIGIIVGISIIILIMFSLVIKLFLNSDHNDYVVSSGSIVFDKDKSIIKLDSDGIIKSKWNNKYYLIYGDNNYELGDTGITYREDNSEIHLYGKYYEVSSDEINITSGETVIKNSLLTKFYKLADRKYLLIDSDIKSTDGLVSTSDFLLVDIDKVGNATMTNNKVNLKSFSETVIVTSNYTFDVANEILSFGNDKIDLKKIIGSSNAYTKEDLIPEENVIDNSDSGNNNSNGNNDININNYKRNETVIEEVKKATKNTSLIAVTGYANKILVDYVIYDPNNEYTSVYLEIKDNYSNNIDRVYLNKNDTTYEINNNIYINNTYNISLKCSYIDFESGEEVYKTIDSVDVSTKKPNISLKVTKTSFGNITYQINTDVDYKIDSATLVVSLNDREYKRESIIISSDNNITVNSIDIHDVIENDIVELKLVDITSNGTIIDNLFTTYKFIY